MRLIGFAIYLGIGAMLHAVFIGPQFDWSSAWTFGWLFGWPIMLIITCGTVILLVVTVITCVWCLYSWLDTYAHWSERRRNAAKLKARKSA